VKQQAPPLPLEQTTTPSTPTTTLNEIPLGLEPIDIDKSSRTTSRSHRVIKKPKFLVSDDSKSASVKLNAPLRKCRDILKTLMSQSHSYIFNEPVDHVTLNIPDYPSIVKNPMDLGTVDKRLKTGHYSQGEDSGVSGVEEFASNVRLVWENALLYNRSPDNFVRLKALEYQKLFEEKFAKVPKEVIKTKTKTVVGKKGAKGKKRKLEALWGKN